MTKLIPGKLYSFSGELADVNWDLYGLYKYSSLLFIKKEHINAKLDMYTFLNGKQIIQRYVSKNRFQTFLNCFTEIV